MDAPVREGDILAGKYRVERVLGVGGMGVVVGAHHVGLDRRVAIKFLLPDAAANPEVVARFAREARAAVSIESEHVARVIDVGALESGAPYMVMEYLVGNDLAHQVAERGALPIEEATDYVLQACEAIAEAHAAGIVHRDLKPANLFLTRRADGSNFVKVLDFGISKAAAGAPGSQPDMSLTRTASVMGSPLYMSPEQMRSTRNVDARADIWALGVILFELLSGKVPFEASTMPELCAMVLTDPVPRLSDRRFDAPPGLSAIIERCLQKDPAQRFANVSELANALTSFAPARSRVSAERISRVLRAAGVQTSSVMPPAQAAVTSEPRPGESTSSAWSPASTASSRRSNTLALGLALLALLVIGAGALALVLRGRGAASVASEEPSTSASSASAASQPVASIAVVSVVTPEPAPAPSPAAAASPSATASTPVATAPVPAAPRAAAVAAARRTAIAAKPAAAQVPAPAPAPAPAPKKNPLNVGLK